MASTYNGLQQACKLSGSLPAKPPDRRPLGVIANRDVQVSFSWITNRNGPSSSTGGAITKGHNPHTHYNSNTTIRGENCMRALNVWKSYFKLYHTRDAARSMRGTLWSRPADP